MKNLLFLILAIIFFSSCEDKKMVREISKDSEIPTWLSQYQCDGSDLAYYVQGEKKYSYLLNLNCQPVKTITNYSDFPIIMLLLFTSGIVIGMAIGMWVVVNYQK